MIAQYSVSARKSSYLSYYGIIAIISTSLPNYIVPRSKVLNLSEFLERSHPIHHHQSSLASPRLTPH